MSRGRAVGVILAAGASRRMGRPKALLSDGASRTFLDRVARAMCAGGCDAVLVVVGRHAAAIAAELPDGVLLVKNAAWERGQLSSARVGLRAALALGAGRMVLHPVDQPLLTAIEVRRALEAARGRRVVVASWRGRAGHPVAFARSVAEAVARDERSGTLREALARYGRVVPVRGSAGCVRGANTPEEYRDLAGPRVPLSRGRGPARRRTRPTES